MPALFRRGLFVVPFLALVAASAVGQPPQKRLIAVEDLYLFDSPRDAALSPDGKSLVYSRQWIDAKTKTDRFSLWLVEGDAKKARPVEQGEPDARAPVFSPDGKWVAFLSTRPRPDGWKQTLPTPPQSDPALDVWLIPAAGGEAIPLAGPDKPYGRVFNDGFYGRLAFSPDGTMLAFIADDGKDPRTDAEKANGVAVSREDQGEGYSGWGAAQLWVAHLDPQPGKFAASKIERITDDAVWYGDPNWHPDGKTVAVHANRTTDRESARFSINKNFDIWAIDIGTKKATQLTTGPGPQVSPRYSRDGTKLACLSVPRKGSHRDAFDLLVVELGEKPRGRIVVDLHGSAAESSPALVPAFPLPADCWDGNGRLLLNCESGVTTVVRWVDVATGKLTIPTAVGLIMPDPDPKGLEGRMALRFELTPSGNRFLQERVSGEQKVVVWKSPDGTEVDGVLTLPPEGVAKPPYKLLVHPHGGPHSRSTLGFDFTVQVFAAKGYAVFQPNFRGSSGYGQKFIDADRGDFGGGDMRDILSGVDKLVADGVADKDRLFVYGVSYGGFMTSWLVGQTDRFRAAVAQNAVTDLNMMWGLSDLQSWTEWEFGGKPWEVPEKMRKHSPLSYVDKVKTPTLILHSRDDRRCPLPMGQAYYRALKARGVPTGLVIYPGEGHGIKQPPHRADVLNRVLAWFEKYDRR
jgi:dipeptidyl aminopeptidase/acylaminoacyl peptidase